MNRKSLSLLAAFLLIALLLSVSTTVFALSGEGRLAQQSTLPQITFLGQGPQTFTIQPPLKFLVKTYENGEFLFVADDGPTYTADRNERVWTIDTVPAESIRLFDELKSYGNVEAGCVVNFVQIEDNVDTRRNTFFINGNSLHVVEQGMVTYGTFTVPESGELTFFAEDSIGMVIELCQTVQTVVPSESPTPTGTQTVVPTETAPGVVISPTVTASVTPLPPTQVTTSPSITPPLPSVTALPSETPPGSPTITATAPGVVITQTPTTGVPTQNPTSTSTAPSVVLSVTPTATLPAATVTNTPGVGTPSVTPGTGLQTPTATAPGVQITLTTTATAPAVQITATPIGTPGALPVTGGMPGPREIATTSITLLGLFLLVGAAWWFLIRAYVQRR